MLIRVKLLIDVCWKTNKTKINKINQVLKKEITWVENESPDNISCLLTQWERLKASKTEEIIVFVKIIAHTRRKKTIQTNIKNDNNWFRCAAETDAADELR